MEPHKTSPPEDQTDPNIEPPAAEEPVVSGGIETTEAPPQEAPAARPTPLSEEEMSYLEQLQRLQAEFSNYRRRVQREKTQWETRAKGDLLCGLLPILDDVARAREAIAEKPDGKDAEGLLLILSRLEEDLRSVGLEIQPIDPGDPFDPAHHEAMMTEPSGEFAEGLILGTLQPGYTYQGLLLRPAKVRVSRGSTPPPAPSETGAES